MNLERRYSDSGSKRFGKVGCIRNLSSKNQLEKSIGNTNKGDKLVREILREPTLRREPTVRSEDFSRGPQGESGESQPTEPTDDAEVRADFWSMQGDFI